MTFHRWIIDNLATGSVVLELGSGVGSGWLVRYFDVVSFEHDAAWVGLVEGVEYVHAPIVAGWYDRRRFAGLPQFDLLLVDGPPGRLRNGIARNLDLFDLDGKTIVVDDIQRDTTATMFNDLAANRRHEIRHSIAGTMFGIIHP